MYVFRATALLSIALGSLSLSSSAANAFLSPAKSAPTYNDECGTGVVTAVMPLDGSGFAFTPAVGSGPDNYEVQEGGTYMMTISGVTECAGDTITVFVQSSVSGNFCFNATGGEGDYSGVFSMPAQACFTLPVSYKCGADAGCSHSSSFKAQGPSSECGGVHLRSSNFDGEGNVTGEDSDCCPEPATSVQLGEACPSLLTITPPVQGGTSTAFYDGNLPGSLAFFFYSPPGTPFFFQGCEIFLNLPFNIGATVLLDGEGNGQVTVPNGLHPCGQELVVQAFVLGMGGIAEVSNGVLLTFGN